MGNKDSKYGLKREAKNGVTRIVGDEYLILLSFWESGNLKITAL